MRRDNIFIWCVFILATCGIVSLCALSTIPILDVGFVQNQTELNKTGYVTDIDFVGGGLGVSVEETIIRFSDGDVVVLQYWETKIPVKQNITLQYHDNGYGRHFLDNFTMLGENAK